MVSDISGNSLSYPFCGPPSKYWAIIVLILRLALSVGFSVVFFIYFFFLYSSITYTYIQTKNNYKQ